MAYFSRSERELGLEHWGGLRMSRSSFQHLLIVVAVVGREHKPPWKNFHRGASPSPLLFLPRLTVFFLSFSSLSLPPSLPFYLILFTSLASPQGEWSRSLSFLPPLSFSCVLSWPAHKPLPFSSSTLYSTILMLTFGTKELWVNLTITPTPKLVC